MDNIKNEQIDNTGFICLSSIMTTMIDTQMNHSRWEHLHILAVQHLEVCNNVSPYLTVAESTTPGTAPA